MFRVGMGYADKKVLNITQSIYTFSFQRLEWPVRTISFSHDTALLASASEDMRIDIGHVDSTEKVAEISVDSPTFTISWHPNRYLLAYACDDKDKYERDRDAGSLKVWGFPSE